ncbi:MAG: gliding motility protein GldM [Paludibacter sp.]|nr:gliding motility protein GldM [Paludibacter sp.]
MSGAKNCPETPRQRMIGMMYLVLTAMLALNVSSEVLNGFTLVDNSLHTTIESSEMRNQSQYTEFQDLHKQNPQKVKEWLDKALTVKKNSDELYSYIENFKFQIIKLADKSKADPKARTINSKDNLDSPGTYAIAQENGKILKSKIDDYRNLMLSFSADNPQKQEIYNTVFYTGNTKTGHTWQSSLFEMMPVSAVVTILTKYQSDIRTTEAEMVQHLKSQTDVSDFRVNKITALVVPISRYIIRGGKYSAQIVLSAVDSTKRPEYFIGNTPLRNGLYDVICGKTGSFNYSGSIKLAGNDGTVRSYPFSSDYIVGEPSATISNEDLNVVYRGIDNKFSISVPGVASDNVSIRVNGGTFTKSGSGKYVIRPTQDGEILISVFGKIDGKDLQMGGGTYRVKYLPDPKSFLQYTDAGGVQRQIFEGNVTKKILSSSGASIVASYGQDELIKANFTVTSFTMQTTFGMINNNGAKLNARQLSDIERLEGGDDITFKNIKAVGPDGKVRSPGLIQVTI